MQNLSAMKNITLLVVCLFVASWSLAQQAQIPKAPAGLEQMPESQHTPLAAGPTGPAAPAGGQTVIWSEDFGNGWPTGWTIDNPGGQCPWVWSNDGSWGFFNGNNGTAGDAPITSTTAANGFLINDPDSANNVNYGQPSGTTYIYHDSYFTTNAIDLSGFPSVNLKFEQYFRFNNTPDLEVMVSNDSTVWTTYVVQGNATGNQASDDPDLVSLNISPVAGNQPNVWIRIGWSARVYFWMIDDMQITEAPDHDITVESVYHRGLADSLYTTFYTVQPLRQAQQDSMIFGAAIENLGSLPQTNVDLTVDIQGPINYNETSAPVASIPVLGIDSAEISVPFYPGAVGFYDIDFIVAADSTDAEPLDNTFSEIFEVSDTVYARDDGNYQGNGIWYGGGTNYEVGCGFDIYTQDTAMSISVLFQGQTEPSSVVSINLYNINDLNTPIASSPFNNLTAGDIGDWETFPLPATPLPPGYYVASFATFSDTVLMAVSGTPAPTPPQSVFINVDNAGWGYTQQFTPFIRLNTLEFNTPCIATTSAIETSVSCNGANDGAINLSMNGGFAPLSYNWSHGATTQDLTGLGGGNYTVTVTDGIGCEYTYTASVQEPAVLASATAATDENCGGEDGVASVGLSGGVAPYFYIWNTFQTGSSIGGLSAGTYTVTYTDAAGCSGNDQVTVGGSGSIVATSTSMDAACGVADGEATITASTGTAPYSYTWSNGDSTATATGLMAGSYTVTVLDSAGCSSDFQVNVSNTGGPVLSAPTDTNVSCNGDTTGSINLLVFGGNGTPTFAWSNGATTQYISGLAAGTYVGTVTDTSNCLLIASFTLTEPDAISTLVNTTSPTCSGVADGQASVNAFGGTGAYTYGWSNTPPDSTSQASGLAAGTYTVTVTDANQCPATASGLISDPTPIAVLTNAVNVRCNGENSGSAGIVLSGGDAPYSYLWDNGATTDQIFGLVVGTYTVTATDANGCSVSQTYSITEPSQMSSSNTVSDVLPDWTGDIDLVVNGGTPPYGYTWTGPGGYSSLSQDPTGLTAKGTYNVVIRDNNNCAILDSATVGGNVYVEQINLLRAMSVVPNPNNGTFMVDFGTDAIGSYTMNLRNVIGQEVYAETVNASQRTRKQLSLSHLDKGVYFLTVNNGAAEITRKVVVQ